MFTSDSYAQLCSGISEKTPEFKEGAKTINFRRILLTRCYEALVEEPEVQQQHVRNNKVNGTTGASSSQHSWRRRCMLRNVRFIGELFRRQLLTENVMHVCVAMMLDDEVKPQAEIIEAACELIALVRKMGAVSRSPIWIVWSLTVVLTFLCRLVTYWMDRVQRRGERWTSTSLCSTAFAVMRTCQHP